MQTRDELDRQLGGRHGRDAMEYRKRFAALATRYCYAPLLFAALDGQLDCARIRRLLRDPKQARQALRELGVI